MAIYDYQGNELFSESGEFLEPMDNDIPVVTISGTLPTAKADGEYDVKISYKSMTDSFTDYGTVKVQGDSSANYPKKNFTIKLFSDSGKTVKDKRQFRDWDKARNKFVLKANWIDHSHARNIVNARLWTQIVKSRSDYDTLPVALTSGNLAIDGFPVKVYNNGVYMGLYTWNLPKDALYGLDEDINTNAIMQGDSGSYSGSILWRASANLDGKWSDETHDVITDQIVLGFDALLNFVYTSSDADFVTHFSDYFDKQSIIDQYIFLYVGCIVDNIGKNQTFFTYNATYYFGGMYDLDGTWGCPPFPQNKSTWYDDDTAFQAGYTAYVESGGTSNLLYERVGTLFASDIESRYTELRASVLSADNINAEFDRFMSVIPPYLYAEDYASTTGEGAFTNIPLKDSNNILQIRQFVIDRLEYVDSMILT